MLSRNCSGLFGYPPVNGPKLDVIVFKEQPDAFCLLSDIDSLFAKMVQFHYLSDN